MTKKAEKCGESNPWGNVCTLPKGHPGSHGDGEYQWRPKEEEDAIRAWFAAGR